MTQLRHYAFGLSAIIVYSFIAVIMNLSSAAYASDVCTFVRVLGHVNLLKGGKIPAIPARIQLGAEVGYGVHTKEASRAQMHFIDDSEMFIAPKSEIIIESYMYNPDSIWKVVPRIIRGLTHTMVSFTGKTDKIKTPPCFLKTDTAVIGVRGTDLYILIGQNFTDIFVKNGNVVAGSLEPQKTKAEYSKLLRQIEVRGGGGHGLSGYGAEIGGHAQLGPQTACRIVAGEPPMEVIKIPLEYFDRLDKLMVTGLPEKLGESKNPKQLLDIISPPSN